jgi:acetyl-CoA C-acetyltransferase
MFEAVIVSTARTGMAKAVRGSFNQTHPIVLGGHALQHAVQRAGIEAGEIEDVILGTGMPEGATGFNIARNVAIKAGCPTTTSGVTINRYCSSGLQSIAFAANQIMNDSNAIIAAGGLESISMVQLSGKMNTYMATEAALLGRKPALWMSMLETAEIVAERYGISREAQDQYAFESQMRTAQAQAAGLFNDEIVPLAVQWGKPNKETGKVDMLDHVVTQDECNRPETTLASLSSLAPVMKDGMTMKEGKS